MKPSSSEMRFQLRLISARPTLQHQGQPAPQAAHCATCTPHNHKSLKRGHNRVSRVSNKGCRKNVSVAENKLCVCGVYMSHVTCVPLTFFFQQQHYYERLLLQWEDWVPMSPGIKSQGMGALIGFLKKNPEKSIRSQRAKLWYICLMSPVSR